MTTSRIKEKISAIVSSQLPDFIQSDFPTFIAFIEAYYRFLEQDQGASEIIQNARSYNDIDRTTDAFVDYFLNTYAKSIPRDHLVNDRFLVKKISDLYESKGSSLSFKLLFRLLYDTTVEVSVPYENVLRASGGNWQQNFSIRVETVSGNRNNVVNRLLRHTSGGVIFETPIVRSKNLTPTLTEIFLDANFLSSSYSIDDLVEIYEGNTLVFSGTIKPTTTSFRITQPGIGFKVGQIFNISAGGIDTLVKVTSVSSSGGLLNLKIISYGYGYEGVGETNNITILLDKDNNVSQRENSFNNINGGFGSSGLVFKSDPTNPDRYFQDDYVDNFFYTIPSIAASFNDDRFFTPQESTGGEAPPNLAVIVFTLGALAAYPGSYFNDESFLSEFAVRLQDDQLYQPFAYQTDTDIDYTTFIDVVKKLINPAGQVLFNNRTLQQEINLSSGLDLDTIRKIFVNIHDGISEVDSLPSLEFNTFNDSSSISDSDELYNLHKNLADDNTTSDQNLYELEKQITDNVGLDDPISVGKLYFRNFEDNVDQLDDDSISMSKSLADDATPSEQIEKIETFIQDYFEEDYSTDLLNGASYVLTKTNEILAP